MNSPSLPALMPAEFIARWQDAGFGERQGAQSFFNDLCALVGHPGPAAYGDPDAFTFEYRIPIGWADAYFEGHFGWEFKGADVQLPGAFDQLLRYQVYLKTPPLLIVSSFQTIRIQTNFPGMETIRYEIPVSGLDEPGNLQLLRKVFFAPDALRPARSVDEVTRATAALLQSIVEYMERGDSDGVMPDPERLASYLNQLVFCLYAEDAGLLPEGLFTSIVARNYREPARFDGAVRSLFAQMAAGGFAGADPIAHFNGDLFNAVDTVPLNTAALQKLAEACASNWRNIEPSIFGTLFERALDASKRAQTGAHYTGADDIMLVVDPVVMQPLRREWDAARREIAGLMADADYVGADADTNAAYARLVEFRRRLAAVTVLDPACGSGNFLYIALRALLDLEKEVIDYAAAQGWHGLTPVVKPDQMLGLEINHYAAELARTALWIGYIQWHQNNGFPYTQEPILTPRNTIRLTDAILDWSDADQPAEPEWPAAEFIVGNPPFLGRRSWNRDFAREYTLAVDQVYSDALARSSDLCCYWFEKARRQIAAGITRRAGLLATQNIRATFSRGVLERINESGSIFMAYPDRDWLLDGANVHIAIIGFDDGAEADKMIDGDPVKHINANLTGGADVTMAQRLPGNAGIAFRGPGTAPFDIPGELAASMLAQGGNPNNRPNSDVVVPVRNGQDLSSRPRGYYTINFANMPLAQAAQNEAPFEYARQAVALQGRDLEGNYWQYRQPAQNMTAALLGLTRFIGHSVTAKHLTFVWVEAGTICNSATNVFARDDDYFFGVLHSRIHEVWARALGAQLRDAESAFRYTPTTCFETFPFPQPTEEQRDAVAAAAAELNRLRENWLNPVGADDGGSPGPAVNAVELRRRTLTNLYNQRPTWLANAHAVLDAAVADAYGWASDLGDAEVLEGLLGLNLERAAG